MNNNNNELVIAHLTDIHLNFPTKETIANFINHCNQAIEDHNIDCFVLTGDISEAPFVLEHVKLLKDYLKRPCYFVCGNHDFYNGSILLVRKQLTDAFNDQTNTCYLTGVNNYIALNDTTVIVGHDGWYDGVYADWFKSKLLMNDYHIIGEFKPLYDKSLFAKIQELAKESAAHINVNARKAIADGYKKIIVASHVPPFPENSTYKGKISDKDWLPHFSSGFMGDTLLQLAGEFKDVEILSLCGHSHGESLYKPSVGNLYSYTGRAEYGNPQISKIHIF